MAEFSRRIPELDGLRGTAILLVLIWHFLVVPTMDAPHDTVLARAILHVGLLTWSGVDLFFVLSGFLIGGILIDAKKSSDYFKTFYARRAFRILPVYLVVVIIYLLVWNAAPSHRAALRETLGSPMPWYLYLTFTQNFWLAHHTWDRVYLTVSWSLAVEEQFYLCLPMIVRLVPRNALLLTSVALTLGSTLSRSLLYLHYRPVWGAAAYTLIFSRADALMIGVICAALLRDPRWSEVLRRKRWATQVCCIVFGLGVAVLVYKRWGMGTMPMCTLGFTCLALFYASILMLVIITPNGLLSRALRVRWLIWLGTISYGLYLFHSITLGIVAPFLLRPQPSTTILFRSGAAISALIAALCLAQLSWNYFESKLVRLGHRFMYGARTEALPPAPVSVVPSD
jgi:peptidoglycan/LPS O-acetylase OafA/YrhL